MRQLCLVLVTALALSACGSKDSPQPVAATTTTTSTTTAAPKPDEPQGKLSAEEYGAVRASFVQLAKLAHIKSPQEGVRILGRGCGELNVQTQLVQRMKSVCAQTRRVLTAVRALDLHERECTRALDAGDVSCYSNLFRSIGRAARVSMVRERTMNAEIRRRGIRGRCGRALDSSSEDLRMGDAMTHDAISAANAAERRDQPAFVRATERLQTDLKSSDKDSLRTDLRMLKACA